MKKRVGRTDALQVKQVLTLTLLNPHTIFHYFFFSTPCTTEEALTFIITRARHCFKKTIHSSSEQRPREFRVPVFASHATPQTRTHVDVHLSGWTSDSRRFANFFKGIRGGKRNTFRVAKKL